MNSRTNSAIDKFFRKEGNKLDESTADRRKGDIEEFLEWLEENGIEEPTEASPIDIEDYLLELSSEYAGGTVSLRYSSVNRLYRQLKKREIIEENPVEEIDLDSDIGIEFNSTKKSTKAKDKSENGIVYIYPEDKELLCESENLPTPKDRNELIIRLFWQTGIRRQELRDLKIENVDRDNRIIKVWSDKTEDGRKVTYNPNLDSLFDIWLTQRRSYKHSSSPYLFITDRSERMGHNTIGSVIRKAAWNAGIQEILYEDAKGHDRHLITPHTLRHSFAVWSVRRRDEADRKMDVRTLQKALGHDSLETSESYLQFAEDDYLEELKRCSPGGKNR